MRNEIDILIDKLNKLNDEKKVITSKIYEITKNMVLSIIDYCDKNEGEISPTNKYIEIFKLGFETIFNDTRYEIKDIHKEDGMDAIGNDKFFYSIEYKGKNMSNGSRFSHFSIELSQHLGPYNEDSEERYCIIIETYYYLLKKYPEFFRTNKFGMYESLKDLTNKEDVIKSINQEYKEIIKRKNELNTIFQEISIKHFNLICNFVIKMGKSKISDVFYYKCKPIWNTGLGRIKKIEIDTDYYTEKLLSICFIDSYTYNIDRFDYTSIRNLDYDSKEHINLAILHDEIIKRFPEFSRVNKYNFYGLTNEGYVDDWKKLINETERIKQEQFKFKELIINTISKIVEVKGKHNKDDTILKVPYKLFSDLDKKVILWELYGDTDPLEKYTNNLKIYKFLDWRKRDNLQICHTLIENINTEVLSIILDTLTKKYPDISRNIKYNFYGLTNESYKEFKDLNVEIEKREQEIYIMDQENYTFKKNLLKVTQKHFKFIYNLVNDLGIQEKEDEYKKYYFDPPFKMTKYKNIEIYDYIYIDIEDPDESILSIYENDATYTTAIHIYYSELAESGQDERLAVIFDELLKKEPKYTRGKKYNFFDVKNEITEYHVNEKNDLYDKIKNLHDIIGDVDLNIKIIVPSIYSEEIEYCIATKLYGLPFSLTNKYKTLWINYDEYLENGEKTPWSADIWDKGLWFIEQLYKGLEKQYKDILRSDKYNFYMKKESLTYIKLFEGFVKDTKDNIDKSYKNISEDIDKLRKYVEERFHELTKGYQPIIEFPLDGNSYINMKDGMHINTIIQMEYSQGMKDTSKRIWIYALNTYYIYNRYDGKLPEDFDINHVDEKDKELFFINELDDDSIYNVALYLESLTREDIKNQQAKRRGKKYGMFNTKNKE